MDKSGRKVKNQLSGRVQSDLVISRILLFLIILFLPTQFGKHFWPSFSFVAGFRLDYLSPAIYFTDLLVFSYIILKLKSLLVFLCSHLKPVIAALVFLILNILFSLSPLSSLFLWLRWIFYFLFLISLRLNKVKLLDIYIPLSLSVLFTVFLELLQLFHQSSIGSFFYYLGERTFNQATPQVAKIPFFGHLFLRPYATFSHPNSLAGYLLLSLFLLQRQTKNKFTQSIAFIGILLTTSKTAIFTTLFYLFGAFKKNYLLLIVLIPLVIFFLVPRHFLSDSLAIRLTLLYPTIEIILHYPIFGVGLGGFFTALVNTLPDNQIVPSLLQPVHNIFLLYIAETGLAGIVFLVYLFHRVFKTKLTVPMLEFLSLIFLTGGLDHYWLTLPQNKLILLITLFIIYNKEQ